MVVLSLSLSNGKESAMFSQTTSKAPGRGQKQEDYTGSYIKSEIDGKYISNKSYESYYGDMLKGFK